jgi:hypothetical protein
MRSFPRFILVGIVLMIGGETEAADFELLNRGLGLSTPLSFTVDGIKLTLSGGGTYNSSSTSFGIDSQFAQSDNPELIDLTETLFFQFDQDVLIDSVTISQFDSDDAGEILFKSAGVILPLQNGIMSFGGLRLGKLGSDRIYAALSSGGGTKGFSVDRMVVRVVPEPSTIVLAAACAVCAGCRRKPPRCLA